MTTAQARTALERMTAALTDPQLSSAEIADLLGSAKRAAAGGIAPDTYGDWAALTAYALSAVVVPTTRNGHKYKVTTAGTSGATEPTWPITGGGTVTNGSVVFTEGGATTWTPTWDLAAAAAEGWRWKMGKCSDRTNFSADGTHVNREQVFAQCARMARFYGGRGGGTVIVPGAVGRGSPGEVPTNAT